MPALAALAVAAACVGAAGTAWGAPFDWASHDWEGGADVVDLARSELGFSRVVVTSRLDYHELQPTDGLVIVHPERTLDVESIARFLKAGGRVVLLDDYGTGDALLAHFGMERVPMPAHPTSDLRGNPSLAIAEPASNAHPAVVDVGHVVTNHATGIKHPDLTPVLLVDDATTGKPVYLAVAGAVGQGRFLAVGDGSIVMNSMLRYGGNKAFARNVLRYAADEDANGHGSGRLFLVEGAFDQTGTFGEDSPSFWAERARAIKDALQQVRNEGMPPPMAYLLAVMVGLGVIWWTGSRAGRTHRSSMPRFTRAIPLAAQGGVAGHAAVVGGERAPRLLAMLELKSALEEDLCQALGIDENPGHEEIVSTLGARQWVDGGTMAQLRAMLLRMANVETMVLSQRAGATMAPVRDREVLAASRDVRRIVRAVQDAARAAAARTRGGS